MKYLAKDIGKILGIDQSLIPYPDFEIETIATDTRTSNLPDSTIFFALPGSINDGHDFIYEAILKGIKNFVVSQDMVSPEVKVNFFKVNNTLEALQKVAAYH